MHVLCFICVFLQITITTGKVSETSWNVAEDVLNCNPADSAILSKSIRSKEECAQLCVQESACALFSYQTDTQTCNGYSNTVPRQQSCTPNLNVHNFRNVKDECKEDGFIYDRVSGICVKLFLDQLPWRDALDTCKSNGLNLVIIDSYDKHIFIKNLVKSRSTWEGRPYWIGGSTIQNNYIGTWMWWNDTPMPTGTTYWIARVVNNTNACASLCASCDYQWHSFPCYYGVSFICEKTL